MSAKEKVKHALQAAGTYGGFDGGHHKMWCIDQMVRILCGSAAVYKEWVRQYEQGEDGPNTYEWDTGIAS